MIEACDNTSVGIIIENQHEEILLIERAKFPYGLAAPAGHIFPHGSSENAAIIEVEQEVGLIIARNSLEKVIEGRRIDNRCRRKNGDHHIWDVYRARVSGQEIERSLDETKSAGWYTHEDLQRIAGRTLETNALGQSDRADVFEQVWLDFFMELGIVRQSLDNRGVQ
jgi:ADP-ribose pyrophosphatase YjhB (NUDIX family)